MEIVENRLSGVPMLTLVGESDQAIGPQLERSVDQAMGSSGHILLDLQYCPYLDSSALGAILDLQQRLEPDGWVGVANCSRMILRLFGLVGLISGTSFRVFLSLDEARAACVST